MKISSRKINYPLALWRRKWLILPFLVLGLVGAGLAFSRMTPLYRAAATVVLVPRTISTSIYPMRWQPPDRVKAIKREINSTAFLESLAEAQGLEERNPDKLRRLTSGVTVRMVDPETFLFASINADPRIAANKANLLSQLFVRQSQERKITNTEESADFLYDEIDRLTREINEEREDLASYQAAHKGELPSDREGHRNEQVFLRQKLSELDARLLTKNKDRDGRELMLSNPGTAAEGNVLPAPAVDPRREQERELRKQLAADKLRYTDRHPQVVRLQASLDALLQDLRENPWNPVPALPDAAQDAAEVISGDDGDDPLKAFVALELIRLNQEITELSAERDQVEAKIELIERQVQASFLRQNEIGRIQGRISLLEGKLQTNQSNLQTLETEKSVFERGMDTRYLLKSEAGVPLLPFHPDLLQFLLFGLAGGGAVGVGLALLLEFMDRSVMNVDDLEDLLDTEVLAVIPNMDKERRRGGPGRGRKKPPGRKAAHA